MTLSKQSSFEESASNQATTTLMTHFIASLTPMGGSSLAKLHRGNQIHLRLRVRMTSSRRVLTIQEMEQPWEITWSVTCTTSLVMSHQYNILAQTPKVPDG